jgi:hypothetical protein
MTTFYDKIDKAASHSNCVHSAGHFQGKGYIPRYMNIPELYTLA